MKVLINRKHLCFIPVIAALGLSSCKKLEEPAILYETTTKTETITETATETTSSQTTQPTELPVPVSSDKNLGTPVDFYKHSIFVGDSIMLGFSKYLTKTDECDYIDDTQVYGYGSYSVRHAVSPVTEDSVNPIYKGEKYTIEDLCKITNSNSVYILLGTNDFAMSGVDKTFENYKTLISRIKEKNPDIRCVILSISYMLENAERKSLNNENIRKLNSLMESYCNETKVAEYIDIATPLSENGFLKEEYCSDGFIHLNNSAYSQWNKILMNFAAKHNYGDFSYTPTNTETKTQETTEKSVSFEIAKAENFFDDAVFIGDSLTVGFSDYLKDKDILYGNPEFLATVSLGTYHALMPLNGTNLHPVYKGKRMRLPDSVSKCGAKKAFVCFGINDLMVHNAEKSFETYTELLEEIKAENPHIKFYILSTPNICSGSESNNLTNKNVVKLNNSLKKYCKENNIDFIDIAYNLTDENGALSRKYSSDGYVHQNKAAYEIWVEILNNFAERKSEV